MSDEIEELFAGLRKAMQRRENDAWKEGFASGEKSAIDNIIAGAMALRKASAEHPLQVATFPVHFPPEAPDAAFLRQALAERTEEEDIEPKTVPLAEMPKLECLAHDYRSAMLSGGFSCIHCGQPEPAASPESEPVEPPMSEGELEDLAELLDNSAASAPAESAANPGISEDSRAASAPPVKSGPDRPMGERPVAPATYGRDQPMGQRVPLSSSWTPAEDAKLRDMPNWRPKNFDEIAAAFPGRTYAAVYTHCVQVLKIPAPTKTQMNAWAQEGEPASPLQADDVAPRKIEIPPIRVTVDDVINKLRIAGDSAYASDSPLFTLFEVNGISMNRDEVLKKANKYRVRAGLTPWEPDQVAWFRPMPAAAPQKAKPPFTRPAK